MQRLVELGLRVRQLRQSRSLAAKETASRAGLSRTSMARLEAGSGNPSFETLVAVADALGVPVKSLFEEPRDDSISALASPGPAVRSIGRSATALASLAAGATDGSADVLHATFGQEAPGISSDIHWWIDMAASPTPFRITVHVTKHPPGGPGEHGPEAHDWDELSVMISGRCEFVTNGEAREVAEGDALFIRRGVSHTVRWSGAAEDRILVLRLLPDPRSTG